jgi:hypothetical protein
MGVSSVGNGSTMPKLSATPGAPAGLTQKDVMILVIQGWDAAGLAGLGADTLVKSNAGLAQPNGSAFDAFTSVYPGTTAGPSASSISSNPRFGSRWHGGVGGRAAQWRRPGR